MSRVKTQRDIFAGATSLTLHDSTYPFIDPSKHTNKLLGKTAVITGGGDGLGKEISVRFHAAGANIVLVGRREQPLNDLASELNSIRANSVLATAADITEARTAERVMQSAVAKFGAVDILINNAAVSRVCSFPDEEDLELYWRVFEVNLRGPILFTHAALNHMKPRNSGTIISINTTGATLDLPYISAYASSKAALLKFQQSISLELQDTDIRLFSMQPGFLPTEMPNREGNLSRTLGKNPKAQAWFKNIPSLQHQTVDLPANTCVALCVEEDAKSLSGRYVNALADFGEVLADAKIGKESIITKENLYWLKMDEL